MNRTTIAGLCLGLLLAPIASAQNAQELIDLRSDAYAYLDALCLEQGLATPNKARPWSRQELRAELERLSPQALSQAGLKAYAWLQALAYPAAPQAGLDGAAGLVLSPEAFVRIPLSGSAYEGTPYDWLHGYEARSALLEIPLELWLGDAFYAIMTPAAKEEHATVAVTDNYANILFDEPNPRIDLYFPFKAYSSLGGPGWSVRFGRDTLSWGNGQSGNLLLSDWSDFYDYLGVSLFGTSIKLSSVYALMDPYSPKDFSHITYSALMAHRLDIRFFDRLTFSVSESVTFGNFQPDLVRDLNTMMIFHNWTIPERTNSLLAVEASYTPWKWFELYGQVAMDEYMTQYEAERDGNGGHSVFGSLLGARGVYPLGPGYLRAGLEWAVTSPWLYNRRDDPYYYNVRRYWSLTTDRYEYLAKPLGYRYGPDAVVWQGVAAYSVPGGPAVSAAVTWLRKGQTTIATEWNPQPGDASPTGATPLSAWLVELSATYPLLSWLEAGLTVGYASRRNVACVSGAASDDVELSARLRLSL